MLRLLVYGQRPRRSPGHVRVSANYHKTQRLHVRLSGPSRRFQRMSASSRGLLVVVAPDAFDAEAEAFVERARGLVRLPDLERRDSRARPPRASRNTCAQQPPRQSAPAPRRIDGQAVDVQLVEDHPARAVGDERADPGVAHDVEARDVGVARAPSGCDSAPQGFVNVWRCSASTAARSSRVAARSIVNPASGSLRLRAACALARELGVGPADVDRPQRVRRDAPARDARPRGARPRRRAAPARRQSRRGRSGTLSTDAYRRAPSPTIDDRRAASASARSATTSLGRRHARRRTRPGRPPATGRAPSSHAGRRTPRRVVRRDTQRRSRGSASARWPIHAVRERVERRHRHDGAAGGEREALNRGDADAQPGERSGAGDDREEIDVGDATCRGARASRDARRGSRSPCVRAGSPVVASTRRRRPAARRCPRA